MNKRFSKRILANNNIVPLNVINIPRVNDISKHQVKHTQNRTTLLKFENIITNVISGSPKLLNINVLDNQKDLFIYINISDGIKDSNIIVETNNKDLYVITLNVINQGDFAWPDPAINNLCIPRYAESIYKSRLKLTKSI